MEWKELVHWILEGLITCAGVYIAGKASQITISIEELNKSVTLLLERSSNQEKRIDRLEMRG